jgi:uncharacterized membrane protein
MAKKSFPVGLTVVLGLGLLLRLVNLGQSFWLDEASQAQMSSWSAAMIWADRAGVFHPPLFYLLAHIWLQFGRSEIWLRTLPLLFGLADIYLLYRLAGKIFNSRELTLFNRRISLQFLSGLFLALNPFHIYYSQEFRSYSLLSFLGALSMYLLYTGSFLWLSVVNALLLYTHYSSVFIILAQLTWIFFYRRPQIFSLLRHFLLSLILYLPWLPQLSAQLQSGINIDAYLPGWRSLLSVSTVKILPLTFFKLTAGRISFLSGWIYFPYIAFVLACVFAAFRLAKTEKEFLFNWILVPVFAMIVFSFVFPQNQPFRVIYVLPGLVLIFVQACARFPKLFLTLFLYIFLVGNFSYFTRPRLQREQWRQAIGFLTASRSESSATVVKFSDKFSPFYWYAPEFPVVAAAAHFPARPDETAAALSFLTSGKINQVYVLDYLGDLTDPHREVDQVILDLGFTRSRTFNFEGVGFIHQYLRQL